MHRRAGLVVVTLSLFACGHAPAVSLRADPTASADDQSARDHLRLAIRMSAMVMADDETYENATPERLHELLAIFVADGRESPPPQPVTFTRDPSERSDQVSVESRGPDWF